MIMPKILVEEDLSILDFTKELVGTFKSYIGRKFFIDDITNILKDYLKPIVDIKSLEVEILKECKFFTRVFLKLGWISKKSRYFWWYHLFFPTLRVYENKTDFIYVIDDETIYRYIMTYSDGTKVLLRFKLTGRIFDKISYRVLDSTKEIDDDEQ